MSIPEIAADIGMGFVPVVGTAQGARDFERARRDSDNLGMVLSAASMIPVVGGAVKAARTVGKASKAADDLAALTAQAPTGVAELNTPTQTVNIPAGKSGKVTSSVPRYWYHSLRGRKLSESGEITPYSRGRETEELLKEGFKDVPANAVYLSPTPFDSDSVRIDVSKLDPSRMRLTGQAEGYAIYGGSIPANAIDNLMLGMGVGSRDTPTSADDLAALTAKAPTDTPEFKNFFSESKVVDAKGKPMPVYHGTSSDFTVFRPSEDGLLGRGIYLSSEERVAKGFRGADKLMRLYASMKNPAYEHDLIPKRVGDKMKGDEYEKELHNRAIDGGFDGIIKGSSTDVFGNPRTSDSWGTFVVFNPTQIKSAIGNEGTFDPTNPVITKAQGGYITKKTKGA